MRKMRFENSKGLKQCLKMLKKLSKFLRNDNKEKCFKGLVNFCADLNPGNQFQTIFEPLVMENTKIFEKEIFTVLKVLQPDQLDLVYKGDLLVKKLIPVEESEKEIFYNKNLDEFIMKILTSGKFTLTSMKFLMIFISNFEVIWSKQKFHKNLIIDLCEVFYNNFEENFSDFEIEKFDSFLVNNQQFENPHFYRDLQVMKDPYYFIKMMIYNALVESGQTKKLQKNPKFVKNFNFSLRKFTEKWSEENLEELVTSKIDDFSYIGSILGFKKHKLENLELILNCRTSKILSKKHTKLMTREGNIPNFSSLKGKILTIFNEKFLISLKTGTNDNILSIRNVQTGKIIFTKAFPNFQKFTIFSNKIFYWGKFSLSIIELIKTEKNKIIPKIVFFKNFVNFIIEKISPIDENMVALYPKTRPYIYLYDFKKNSYFLLDLKEKERKFLDGKIREIELGSEE